MDLIRSVTNATQNLRTREQICQQSKSKLQETLVENEMRTTDMIRMYKTELQETKNTLQVLTRANASQEEQIRDLKSKNTRIKNEHQELWSQLLVNTRQLADLRSQVKAKLEQDKLQQIDVKRIETHMAKIADNQDALMSTEIKKKQLENEIQSLTHQINELNMQADVNLKEHQALQDQMNIVSETYKTELSRQINVLSSCESTNQKLTQELEDKTELEHKLSELMEILSDRTLNTIMPGQRSGLNSNGDYDQQHQYMMGSTNDKYRNLHNPYPEIKAPSITSEQPNMQSSDPRENKTPYQPIPTQTTYSPAESLMPSKIISPAKQSGFIALMGYDPADKSIDWAEKLKKITLSAQTKQKLSVYQRIIVKSADATYAKVVANSIAPMFQVARPDMESSTTNKNERPMLGHVLIYRVDNRRDQRTTNINNSIQSMISDKKLLDSKVYTNNYESWEEFLKQREHKEEQKGTLRERIRLFINQSHGKSLFIMRFVGV